MVALVALPLRDGKATSVPLAGCCAAAAVAAAPVTSRGPVTSGGPVPGDRHGADRAAGRKNQYAKIQVSVIVMLAQRLEQQTCQAMVLSSDPLVG